MTAAELELLGVTPASILYVWSWGFGSVVTMWFFGWLIGVASTAIRKI